MKNWISGLLLAMGLASGAQAVESALYVDNVLTISDAIVMEGDKPRYYRDVQLEIAANGDFRVVDAVEKQLAYVEEIAVAVLFTDPPQVELNVVGYKSNPCVELNIAVTRKGNTFYVAVGETPLQTLVACIQVTDPFDIMISLDVRGLPVGNYQVIVNDQTIDFDLE
jgi:hypothetical protein